MPLVAEVLVTFLLLPQYQMWKLKIGTSGWENEGAKSGQQLPSENSVRSSSFTATHTEKGSLLTPDVYFRILHYGNDGKVITQ